MADAPDARQLRHIESAALAATKAMAHAVNDD
jgi:hypothetical protein